ncbi:PREDICTED: nuclear [Prunus dulcis]|uniref:PREDICTED: nuclear n=2 Tax=Prunus dulcis TaxID=3755 RepID=A0A5E4G1Y0_PRUDU|nr:PREDICTED: nuclear [Prunus dulcis]
MDVNRSINITPSSNTSPEMHGFMSTGSFELPNYYSHPSSREEADQEAKQSSFTELQKEEIEIFWNQQLFEIQNTTVAKAHHELPLARVKRVMKSDGQVKKVSSETPVLFSKACELFIMELTLRSWLHTERSKRRTLQHCDTARAIMQDELLHFLVHAVPPLNSVVRDYFEDDE